jgi:uncharacterized protein (TIGR02271 family)
MSDHDPSANALPNDRDAEAPVVGSAGPEPEGSHAPASGVVVDRSEERLSVRTIARPVERVRLEKFIVTEEQTITVTVRREEVRLVRDLDPRPESDARAVPVRVGDAQDVALTLHEERIVVTREVVPVERVRLHASVATEHRRVEATLRKERVEVTQDTGVSSSGS